MSLPDIVVNVLENSKELDRLRKEQEIVLVEINKMHKRLKATPEMVEKPGDTSLLDLKTLYIRAKELSESEEAISTLLTKKLDVLLSSETPGQPRRRIGKGKSAALNTHQSSCIFATIRFNPVKSSKVAARVTPHNADKDVWFVVKVIHFDKETKEFEVLDEEPGDDEEGNGQRQYKLPMSNIIPFPKRNDPSNAPDFPHGTEVLAVYPGTTALYKATVVNGHRKRKTDDYLLEFDDDEEDGSLPQRTVPFHKVVPLPQGHRQ
ncbi:SAGA-associated factor 29-like protein A-like isoform X1 [Senna tora]|uniref:SAGA-associated factor 29-like protein A-like isoform X1 n=1 Tax=Senna tora TaxID=362788 RepID=A0A834TCC6_9FABA|nr:SAGA-associated factor 29-like protein A-like isoform X1 [Senna tora]